MPDAPATIADILAAAEKPGHAHRKAFLGIAAAWLVSTARNHGLEIFGYRHVIDTSAIRHILAKHGDFKAEALRGQIAISSDDILHVREAFEAPEVLVFGAFNRRRQPLLAYIKKYPDGSTMLLEELRSGRTELAIVSTRKHPATIDANTIAGTLNPNGRTDGGANLHIVDMSKNVTFNQVVRVPSRQLQPDESKN